MSSTPGPNANIGQIFRPIADLGSLANVVQQLKNAVDSMAGFSGGPLDRAVTFNDLVRLGLADATTIQSPRGAADFATNTNVISQIGTVNGTITAFTSQPHTWTAEQKFTSADGSIGVLISGASKGVQFVPSASGITIEATDNSGAGHQPLFVDASAITFKINGADSAVIGSGTLNVVTLIQVDGFNFLTQSTNYNIIYDNAGNQSVFLGNNSDTTNYYRQTLHRFGGIGGANTYIDFGSIGVQVWNNTAQPAGGMQGSGTINAYGFYIGGVPLQTVATNNQTTVTAPAAGSSSGTGVMMGLDGSITPSRSGSVRITISGTSSHSNSGGSTGLQIRTGTGTAPVNGVALTGTARGLKISPNTAAAGQKMAFSLTVIVTGLTVNTAIWIDLALDNGGAGTATVQNLVTTVHEL